MKYCSECGSSELARLVPDGDINIRTVCKECGIVHYSNPKIVTGCLVTYENKILLCQRAIEPQRGYWNLPCGYLENGECVEAGAMREVEEEAEAKVKILGLHCIYSLPHINQVYIHFLAELINGKFGIGPESLKSELFLEKFIPWEELAFSSSTYSLKQFFSDRKKGQTQTHFGSFIK